MFTKYEDCWISNDFYVDVMSQSRWKIAYIIQIQGGFINPSKLRLGSVVSQSIMEQISFRLLWLLHETKDRGLACAA